MSHIESPSATKVSGEKAGIVFKELDDEDEDDKDKDDEIAPKEKSE